MRKITGFLLVLFIVAVSHAQNGTATNDVVSRIKEEGLQRSKVMDIAFHLTDVSGSRLTASPGFMRAAIWAKNTLAGWGLVNATLEPWGEFGKGWQQEHCYVAMTKPYYHPLIAIPRAWTGSTPGNKMLTGKIVLVKAKDSTELMAYKGKLANKIVMTFLADTLKPSFVSDASRFHDTDLIKMAEAAPRENAGQPRPPANPEAMQTMMRRFAFQRMLGNFLQQEKP
ncbi:MAG: peptidase M28, partial [Flavisolibacter sp.]|nr:peptidase M28 [Flavisolibacter sp.]